ncbi:Shroom3 isoform X1 [Pelobates cultripes]|uniref:Shroom3 isoform X1 n=1 Tax=Pelobates cultripes TaxID=61616 RepID=A0AAD1SH61_PELCU|nr:Shroom3 isoform X1 [Pelobates cultripes]
MMQISQGTIGSPWHQAYHSSSSTSDLSSYDHGYLRRSPDQYSSRGSMESLEHMPPTFHPCHHLSPAKSTNCIDQLAHLHSKRDSAYSSFSTNSSIPEYHQNSFSKERSYSMESMHSRNNLQEGIKHADIRYIKTVYDAQRGVSEEYEVNSSSFKNRSYSRLSSNNRNSTGLHSRLEQSRVFSESDGLERGPPMPPARSDSYAITKHHERPSSWSSSDQNRSLRTHSKATGPHLNSGTCNLSQQLKPLFGEGQLHTVMEKSPESSPLTKPKHIYSPAPQPGQPMLPTGIYPVPSPEPHFAHAPSPLKNNNGRLYPALAKEGAYTPTPLVFLGKNASDSQFDNNEKDSQNLHNKAPVHCPTNLPNKDLDKNQDGPAGFAQYKLHFSVGPEIPTGSSLTVNDPNVSQKNQELRSSKQQIKNGVRMTTRNQTNIEKQSKGEVLGLPINAENRILNEVPFQNELKMKQDTSSPSNIESYRNENIDTLQDKHWGNLHNNTPSSNNRPDESPRRQDLRNKLDNPSFTKHIEDAGSSVVLSGNHLKSEDTSLLSQTKNCEFRRRLSSSSTQSSQSVQYSKADANKPRSSVLEKICKIEEREQESHRSQVSSGNLYGQQTGHPSRGLNNRGSVNSIEEIRNRFNSQEHNQYSERCRLSNSQSTEKVSNVQLLKRTGSVYSMVTEESKKDGVDSQIDKVSQYKHEQRVVEVAPNDNKLKVDAQTMPNKDAHWANASQDTLGFNRAYRNSIKHAQSKVLEATSFRRKDLEITPPQYKKQEKNIKRPTSAILLGKTSPVSPHAPKERHSITPTDNSAKFQDIQSLEKQGISFPVTRIGARRRLTAEQKKRSYSEPEKMNEVGASENESSALNVQKRGQNVNFIENTVADRRRMFERDGKASSTVNLSKPELKQLQQNALADYIERKTGRRPSSQEAGFLKERSQSTYFTGSMLESQSNSSTSSINLLQDHISYRSRDTKTRHVSSTLPPGLTGLSDLASFEQDIWQESRGRSSSFANQRFLDYRTKTEFIKSTQIDNHMELNSSRDGEFGDKTVERVPGKSASAEDLLDTLQPTAALHVRSQSTPSGGKKSQDVKNMSRGGGSQVSSNTRSKDVCPFEKQSFHSTLHSHLHDHSSTAGGNHVHLKTSMANHSVDVHSKHARTQSLTPTFGNYSRIHESKPNTLPLSNQPTPSKIAHPTQDFITAEEYLYMGKQDKLSIPSVVVKDESAVGLTSPDHNSLEDLADNARAWKAPQRPPPPKIKSINDGTFKQKTSSCPLIENKLSPGWTNELWSTSSSENEPLTPHGKISLRISESCLQSSAPLILQDDEDDEVFVKEPEMVAFYEEPIIVPPTPPSSLEDVPLKEKQETLLTAPTVPPSKQDSEDITAVQVKEDINKRYLLDSEKFRAPLNIEACSMISTSAPIKILLSNLSTSIQAAQPIACTKGSTNQYGEGLPASQEDISSSSSSIQSPTYESHSTLTSYNTKLMSLDDVKSQELAKEIVNKDKSLADILDPESKMKTTMDLMSGLFTKSSAALKENSKKWERDNMLQEKITENGNKEEKRETAEFAQTSSAYSSLSAPKVEDQDTNAGVKDRLDSMDINEKKAELIDNITHKLEIMKDAKESLLLDIKINNSLGEEVETLIESLCKPNEYDKYKMFIGDLDKVVNLLLSLSGRLARVENVLSRLTKDTNAEERKTWNEKKKQLCGQHEDARELKENLDRREKLVMDILGNYLTGEQFQEYQHFVKMKSTLLIKQRELDDKIKLGQEQLKCLLEGLPSDFQIGGKVLLTEGSISSFENMNIPPPLTSSL